MNHYKQAISPFGEREVSIEFGEIGRQADAAVMVDMEGTVVLVAVTGRREALPNASFLPLTVDYQEKTYAAGKIPGGFFRREGRPSEKEVLTCRLIDRSLRPLFPDFYYHETQVIATVMSFNPEVEADIPAMIGAAAAMELSGIPFAGPIAAARVGRREGQIVVNPTCAETAQSDLDLIVAGSKNGVLMVESEARELPEETMLQAVMSGHAQIQNAIAAISQLVERAGKPKWDWQAPKLDDAKKAKIKESVGDSFAAAYRVTEKQARTERLSEIRRAAREAVVDASSTPLEANLVNSELKKMEAAIVRERILSGEPRIDGRGTRDIRPISIRLGALPRVHGSALFTRGETQALVAATLGTGRDEQKIETLHGERFERFLMHYNMPPYATGETGRSGIPKRREIGHGRLAKRSLTPVLPDLEEFGYALRLVSEITESNGSSSMASVCGGSLALMDAGVPIARHVSGVAMGLIMQDERFAVLSDILGDEDHLGDMDFKVAGTENGVTALQMDLKIDSVSESVMQKALAQAREGRFHILEKMREALSAPREEVSQFAPHIMKIRIATDKIRDVIGKGGSVIRNITEMTGASVDIEDDGRVTISGPNHDICSKAKEKIESITVELQVGKVYEGKVESIIENVGAVVSILPGRDGLLHISQIAEERVERVEDYLQVGQIVQVKLIQSDQGRVRFTMRNLDSDEIPPSPPFRRGRDDRNRGDRGDRGDRGGDRGRNRHHRGDRNRDDRGGGGEGNN